MLKGETRVSRWAVEEVLDEWCFAVVVKTAEWQLLHAGSCATIPRMLMSGWCTNWAAIQVPSHMTRTCSAVRYNSFSWANRCSICPKQSTTFYMGI